MKKKFVKIKDIPARIVLSFALLKAGPKDAAGEEKDDKDNGEPDDLDKFTEDGEEVENLPPVQPDVDPLKRENPDQEDIQDNEPLTTEKKSKEKKTVSAASPPITETIVVDRNIGKDDYE